MEEIIKNLKKLAMKHYLDGGDMMIECWDNEDWKEFIEDCDKQGKEYDKYLLKVMGALDSRRKDIESTAF